MPYITESIRSFSDPFLGSRIVAYQSWPTFHNTGEVGGIDVLECCGMSNIDPTKPVKRCLIAVTRARVGRWIQVSGTGRCQGAALADGKGNWDIVSTSIRWCRIRCLRYLKTKSRSHRTGTGRKMLSQFVPFIVILTLGAIIFSFIKQDSIPTVPNATPNLPILGNSLSFRRNPVQYLISQRARHGDVFRVNLGVVRLVFFLGPEGTNAVLSATESSGISLFEAIAYLFGRSFYQGIMHLWCQLIWGLELNGNAKMSQRVMRRFMMGSDAFKTWVEVSQSIARERIEEWDKSGESVDIFREISALVMTVILSVLTGSNFAKKHAREIIPMVQAYESAMQKPEVKALPHWASKSGRFVNYTERRMKELIDEEVRCRVENPEKHKDNRDYLQMMLETEGHPKGNTVLIEYINVRSFVSYSWIIKWGTWKPGAHIRVVSTSCPKDIASIYIARTEHKRSPRSHIPRNRTSLRQHDNPAASHNATNHSGKIYSSGDIDCLFSSYHGPWSKSVSRSREVSSGAMVVTIRGIEWGESEGCNTGRRINSIWKRPAWVRRSETWQDNGSGDVVGCHSRRWN